MDRQRAGVGLIEKMPYAFKPCDHENLIQPRDNRRGAKGYNQIGKAGNRQFGAFHMQVPVDHAGRQIAAFGIMNARLRPLQWSTLPIATNVVLFYCDFCGVNFSGGNVDQFAVGDHQIGLDVAVAGPDQFSKIHLPALLFAI